MTNNYDLIIIGSGPAGLTAAIYAARANLRTLIFEEGAFGGAILNANMVENFPCFPGGISGSELMAKLVEQVMQYGVELMLATVNEVELLGNQLKKVITTEGAYLAKAVIIAGGARPKKLGIPGEDEFEGKGLFYCAYCDGIHYGNKEVAIIGGGDGGISEGLYMTEIASKVTVIERLPKLTASIVYQKRAEANPKMEICCSTVVEEIVAEGDLMRLKLKKAENERTWDNLKVAAVFVHAGLCPRTEYLKGLVDLDSLGFVVVKPNMETSAPGIFAAGDIRSGTARQAITAAGDGANAAIAVGKFIALGQKGTRVW